MERINDFRQKEVINIEDGKRLGFVSDIELNLETGKVEAIIVPGPGKIFGLFGGSNDYVIPWNKIKKIGDDIILVSFGGS